MASLRERLVTIFKILLATTLIIILLINVSFERIILVFRGVLVGWLAITIVLFVLVNCAKAYQYHLLMSDKVSFRNMLNVVFVQNVVSNLIATGAGIASLFVLFNMEHGLKTNQTLRIFLLAKAGDLIQILFFLSIATWAVWDDIGPLHLFVIILLTCIAVALIILFLLFFLREKFFAGFCNLITSTRMRSFPPFLRMLNIFETIAELDSKFVLSILSRVLFGAFIYMFLTLGWIYATLQTFQLSVGVMPLVFVGELQQLISYLPIQVLGGLGLNDLSTVYFFSLFGYETELLIAIAVSARLLSYMMNLALFLYLLATGVWWKTRVEKRHLDT